ncbi:MAG: peptidase S8/S53 subtilisin kexin sedolisin [Azonexus sp.]|jgi:hypothetical protein|nr:peptidase S8/S53 subtilisin kexin sedolisin [Azonexus sp.]
MGEGSCPTNSASTDDLRPFCHSRQDVSNGDFPPGPHIGVIDSGHASAQTPRVAAARRFTLTADGVIAEAAAADPLGHGSAVLDAIASRAPSARFSVAQVFDKRGVTTPLQVAAALEWLCQRGVRLVNLSLGLRRDRPVLRQSCADLLAAGVLICAASPARGGPVFPAHYPGVIRATGDARCAVDQWSWLDSREADFAACVGAATGQAGASLGCAAFSGHLAALLATHPAAANDWLLQWLRDHAHYHGSERKTAP